MKIIVPAIGSRGDVQPYIALCQGLQRAGHDVMLATNPTLCSLVDSYGVRVAPVGPPVDMGAEGARIWAQAGRNFWLGFMRIAQLGLSLLEKSHADLLALCTGADLVVTTDVTAGAAEADKLGIPWVTVTLQPGRVPDPAQKLSLPAKLMWGALGTFSGIPMNRFRKRVGVGPIKGGITGVLSDRLVLIPVSRHVAPARRGWPAHVHFTGYWFATPPGDWTPPADLLDFLAAGDKPIAISLGAMSLSGQEAAEAARIAVAAVQQAGVRAIVQGWDEPLAQMHLPATIYHAGSMPHTWLFDQVGAIVHHGGFGTTASALRAGVPAIVVPHIIDQIFWAQAVHELGVGPRPIHRADLTVDGLAGALRQAMEDAQMRSKAAALGAQIRAEPEGVQVAVRYLEGMRA